MTKPIDHWEFEETAIVRDMRQTARELGIVDLLLELQTGLPFLDRRNRDLVGEALNRLGWPAKEGPNA